MSQQQIADELGRTKATINWHAQRMSAPAVRYEGRDFIVRVLGYSGLRNSELCDLRIRHVRLHDPEGARFQIPDAKTQTGVRSVEITPRLAKAFVEHLEGMRAAGHTTGLDDHVIQNTRGGRVTRQRVAAIVREAAHAATEARAREGLPPMPRTTPHSLRRTYISVALRSNNYDVKWVMSQVGHADSKMTLDVYAQLEQRAKRQPGARFDELTEEDDADDGSRDTTP
jgi:integrase